ncbi:PAS domain S-box protein [Caenimonas koreensis]|uniref:PAS domain-containing hybrid sensor histidine kinase/response regulator n=1 Tax=Caenimonas koreensis TaxID=367474 RepID=UPI003783A6D1
MPLPLTPAAAIDAPLEQRLQLLIEAVVDYAILILTPEGLISSWNSGAEKLKGYTRKDVLGRHISMFYEPDAVARAWPDFELQQAVLAGRFEDEGWRVRKDGSRFWANVVITAVKDDTGALTGFIKITRDLTERRRHEEALRTSEERFRLLVESVRDYGIFMLDTEGFVQGWNAGAQAIKGYAAEEIVGRHFSNFYTPEDRLARRPERGLAIAREQGRVEDEGWRVRKDGTAFWANVVITAIRNERGELLGFGKVTRDMTERRKLSDLEASSRRMNEFLAMLAHELRNPLAPIRNAVSIMRLESNVNPVVAKSRDIIDRQLTHITRLVDDLLDVGRLTTGKIKLRQAPTAMADVVARSVETMRPVIDAHHHSLKISMPAEPVFVSGDLTRLAQVMQNLLANAARYTPDGGIIEIRVELMDQFVATSVIDNGRGIDAGELEAIFELFHQGDNGKSPTDSGLGIGLTLARSLVELHGGTLEASSAGRGQGSSFRFRLPLVVADLGAAPAPPEEEAAAPLRVLVVDDNRDGADSTTDMLRLLGHEAQCAYGGAHAIGMAAHFAPDVVLLDLSMPGIDGFETLRQLRELPGAQGAFIVAMTGYGAQQDTRRTSEAGFDAHLTKPAPLEALIALLDRVRV